MLKGGYNAVSCIQSCLHWFDSHAKHGQSLKKKKIGRITEYFCAKNLTSGFVQVSESFFFPIVVLYDVNDGGTPYMGISPGNNASVHTSTRARARPSTRFNRQAGSTGLAREECL